MATKEEVDKEIILTKRGRIAIITIDRQKKLGALTQDHYFRIAENLRKIEAMDDIVVTLITGKGRFFSAGADVTISRTNQEALDEPRKYWARTFVSNNLHNSAAWYEHSKILVVALNGPAVGISAAFTAHADFIYCAPHAYIATPFSSLGLTSEGAASRAFVERLGISKANEALLWGRKLPSDVLLRVGYVNKIIEGCGGDKETGKGIDTDKFLDLVLKEVDDKLGEHLVPASLLKIKKQIRSPGMDMMNRANLEEIWGGLDVFIKGVPQKEFQAIAEGRKRHKL